MVETLMPDPEPPLKMIPSVLNQSRIEFIESSTERMKQAEACCGTRATPMLSHTGELKDACCMTMRYFSSSEKMAASSVVAKYPPSTPHRAIVSTTRSTICLTLVSRAGVPSLPRKYFDATTFVAVIDQNAGTSTPFCSKTFPASPGITASRRSQTMSSYGCTPSLVNVRAKRRPCSGVRSCRADCGGSLAIHLRKVPFQGLRL